MKERQFKSDGQALEELVRRYLEYIGSRPRRATPIVVDMTGNAREPFRIQFDDISLPLGEERDFEWVAAAKRGLRNPPEDVGRIPRSGEATCCPWHQRKYNEQITGQFRPALEAGTSDLAKIWTNEGNAKERDRLPRAKRSRPTPPWRGPISQDMEFGRVRRWWRGRWGMDPGLNPLFEDDDSEVPWFVQDAKYVYSPESRTQGWKPAGAREDEGRLEALLRINRFHQQHDAFLCNELRRTEDGRKHLVQLWESL